MQPGQLNEFLKARGIDRGSLLNQLTASIVGQNWCGGMPQNTEITDEEVDAALKRIKEHAGEPQSRIAEIFLAVDNPSQDQEVRNLAEKLTEQMKQGARFSAVAQQFSQSATAAVGGDMGWLRPDQLPPEFGRGGGAAQAGRIVGADPHRWRLLPAARARPPRRPRRRWSAGWISSTSCRSSCRCRRSRPTRPGAAPLPRRSCSGPAKSARDLLKLGQEKGAAARQTKARSTPPWQRKCAIC